MSYCWMSSIFNSNTLFREECLYGIQRDVLHPLLVGIGKHGAAESLKVTENKGNMQAFYIFMNVQLWKNHIFMNVQPRKNHIFMNVRGISWLLDHVLSLISKFLHSTLGIICFNSRYSEVQRYVSGSAVRYELLDKSR